MLAIVSYGNSSGPVGARPLSFCGSSIIMMWRQWMMQQSQALADVIDKQLSNSPARRQCQETTKQLCLICLPPMRLMRRFPPFLAFCSISVSISIWVSLALSPDRFVPYTKHHPYFMMLPPCTCRTKWQTTCISKCHFHFQLKASWLYAQFSCELMN